jgi:hypothetical protein
MSERREEAIKFPPIEHRLLFLEKMSAIALTFLLISETNFPKILPSHLCQFDRPLA